VKLNENKHFTLKSQVHDISIFLSDQYYTLTEYYLSEPSSQYGISGDVTVPDGKEDYYVVLLSKDLRFEYVSLQYYG